MTGTTIALETRTGRGRMIGAALVAAVLLAVLAVTLLFYGPTSGGSTPAPTHHTTPVVTTPVPNLGSYRTIPSVDGPM